MKTTKRSKTTPKMKTIPKSKNIPKINMTSKIKTTRQQWANIFHGWSFPGIFSFEVSFYNQVIFIFWARSSSFWIRFYPILSSVFLIFSAKSSFCFILDYLNLLVKSFFRFLVMMTYFLEKVNILNVMNMATDCPHWRIHRFLIWMFG